MVLSPTLLETKRLAQQSIYKLVLCLEASLNNQGSPLTALPPFLFQLLHQ